MSGVHDRLIGVEQEYEVFGPAGKVDFRSVIDRLGLPGHRIDPGDRHAYFTPSGIKVTCDGEEAEIATPAIPLSGDVAPVLAGLASQAYLRLADVASEALTFRPASTHVSVSLDDAVVDRASGMFARTFAAALLQVTEGVDSPGLLIRPRLGRLEFGFDYVQGAKLIAGILLAAGGAIVCERAASSYWAKSALPPAVRVEVVRAVDRYGWYVDRSAFGVDVLDPDTRSLRRELAGRIDRERHLKQCWHSARSVLEGHVDAESLEIADSVIAHPDDPPAVDHAIEFPRSWLGAAMRGVTTPDHTLTPVVATWDYVVFSIDDGPAAVSVPAADLERFIGEAEAGNHDSSLASGGEGVLATYHQALEFGFWESVTVSPRLAAPERDAAGTLRLAPG